VQGADFGPIEKSEFLLINDFSKRHLDNFINVLKNSALDPLYLSTGQKIFLK